MKHQKEVILLQEPNSVMSMTGKVELYFKYQLLIPTSETDLFSRIYELILEHNEQVGGE